MNNICVVLCLLAFFAFTHSVNRVSRNDAFMNNLMQCKQKVNAADADVNILKNRQRLTTKASQCLMACIKKKMGVMAEDNTINLSVAKENLGNLKTENKIFYDKFLKYLDECKSKETLEMDECLAAKKFSDCLIDMIEKD